MASSFGGPYGYGYGYGDGQQQPQPYPPPPPYGSSPSSSFGSGYRPSFPPGTDPEAIRSFEMADRDWSGYIDEEELQQALCSGPYQRFSTGTVRLLIFLFKNPTDPIGLGPKEFAALWSCLGQWRAIFERFDGDRSGKIDLTELRDSLYSLGCGMIVKGLTEKFKEKDLQYTGSATLGYDEFMCMILPFLVSYD
ncbi:probable calcium-binding protein CML50 isoform X1 [Eucalyptus grandis]|uniref:probable calcium-binding protein CML50 isoform X1 n=1 Tax=Eucalyptus grandis TaxID=71139 RepID=UPI00192E8FC4|nr:probable calcium-binding protein CML50 isoform X1 [Eucalyptus grandis]